MRAHSLSKKTNWLSVKHYFDSDKPTELLITGPIGETWWDDSGTSEKAFLDALKDIPEEKEIVVGINSEGGSVKDGLGIYHALRRRGDSVTTRVDGYAVSIASVIALAGSKRISPESSIWMIHEPWSMAVGDSETMRKEAAALDAHAEAITAVYDERTSLSVDDARAKMKAETWFRGGEAKQWGFATDTGKESPALAALDFTKFRNVPKDILQRGRAHASHVRARAEGHPHPAILRAMRAGGVGIEAAAPGEVARALACGHEPRSVLLSATNARPPDLAETLARGVRVALGSRSDVRRVGAPAPGGKVLLRVNPGVGDGHHAHVVTGGAHSKFGIPVEEIDVARAEAEEAGLEVEGLHAHVGSGILDPGTFVEAAETLLAAASRIAPRVDKIEHRLL